MEQKLAEYRAKKQKTQHGPGSRGDPASGRAPDPDAAGGRSFTRATREKMRSLYGKWRRKQSTEAPDPPVGAERTEVQQRTPPGQEEASPGSLVPPQDPPRGVVLLLKLLLWLVLLGLFVELEFGLAYFIISMFYWLYEGTRGPRDRKDGEKSAYSVFNPGCEAIEGTLTAEQFERELQYRPLAGL
uniref:SAYSVFN motif domain containing 1 n=1 Tax=Leptobrachium leishanense TaxID=445787 RepID=A0A8C5MIK3_9ANUR